MGVMAFGAARHSERGAPCAVATEGAGAGVSEGLFFRVVVNGVPYSSAGGLAARLSGAAQLPRMGVVHEPNRCATG
jgi:hypothetical protein